MGQIWTGAFWKDAVERLGTTFVSILIGFMTAEDFGWTMLNDWQFWSPIAVTMVVNLLKVLIAGFARPNTGASLGTTIPTDQTRAAVDVTQPDKPVVSTQTGQPVEVTPMAA